MPTLRISEQQKVEQPDAGLRLDPAPRAFGQFLIVVMSTMYRASFERLRQRIQRLYPFPRLWPVSRQKCATKKFHKRRGQGIERQSAGRLLHLTRLGVGVVGEAGFSDRPLQWHLSCAQIPPRKRMPAQKEKL